MPSPFNSYTGYLPPELRTALDTEVAGSSEEGGGDEVSDASTSVKGITKLATAPATASNPVAVGDNDPRLPSQDENDALVGTSGAASSSNKYVTNADTRNTDDRTASGLRTSSTVVVVSAATAPTSGQTLVASSTTVAAWATPVKIDTAQTFTASQRVASVGLSDGASIATDAALGNVFTVSITDDRTLADPTNLVSGGTYIWVVTQGAGAPNTLAFGSLFKFDDTLGTPSLAAATSSDILVISAVYNGSVLLCGWTFYTL